MGLIPEAVIDEVISRADIIEVVQQYVTLKRAGSNWKGLCPFHDENTPSFNVHPGKGIYKCFGCGKGGNVVGFVMELEGWNFPEAVRQLAERYGVEIPEESDEDAEKSRQRREAKKSYLSIMDDAQQYFVKNLWSDGGRAARHYLKERGITEETARAFGLGYAPQGWSNLLDHLGRKGIDPRWLERAGLALPRRTGGGFYDRFRHRIMFPVVDIWGHTLAFSGRVFAGDDDGPKYINSPETRFYTKGDQLYGIDVAKQAIQKAERALLVEGNFDVVALHAAGIDVAVAPLGTALTPKQARLLGRYSRRVIVAFDGDSAGKEATVRCLPALEEAGIEARVVRFEETDDPDAFVRRRGAEALLKKMDESQDLVVWALDQVLPRAERGDVQSNVKALEEAGELLRAVENDVAREQYAREIARRLAIEPRLVSEYIKRPKSTGERVERAVAAAQRPMELPVAEYGVLVALLDHPEWLDGFLSESYDHLLASAELSEFLRGAAQAHSEGRWEPAAMLDRLEPPAFRATVEEAMLGADELYQPDKARHYYEDCIRSMQRQWAERALREIEQDLEHVDFATERERWQELVEQQKEIQAFRRRLQDSSVRTQP